MNDLFALLSYFWIYFVLFKACYFYQDNYGNEEIAASNSVSFGRYRPMKNVTGFKNSSDRMEFAEQIQDSSVYGCSEAEKRYGIVTPLYQRVLSALILDEEIESFEETGFGRPRSLVNDSCLIDAENKFVDKLDLSEPIFGVQTQRNGNADIIFSCNGNGDFDRHPSAQDCLFNGERLQRDGGYVHSEVEVLVRLSRCDYVVQSLQTNNGRISPIDCQYEQMCVEEKLILELQSIGLFVEAVVRLRILRQEFEVVDFGHKFPLSCSYFYGTYLIRFLTNCRFLKSNNSYIYV